MSSLGSYTLSSPIIYSGVVLAVAVAVAVAVVNVSAISKSEEGGSDLGSHSFFLPPSSFVFLIPGYLFLLTHPPLSLATPSFPN